LAKDIVHAPGIKNKLLYLIMPPGWHHSGDHKLAKDIRQQYINDHVENRLHTQKPLIDPSSENDRRNSA
jgi:hypothetical protein